MKKLPKPKKGAWFIKVRGSYLPMTWQSRLMYIPYLGFLIASLVVAFRTQETAIAVVFMLFPQWVAAAVVMTWIASRKS